jgi:hypothetical protein
MNTDLADRETDPQALTLDSPVSTAETVETAERQGRLTMADCWAIEGSESGA